jgi:dihydropyrimidinase
MTYDLLVRGGDAILPGTGRTACDIAVTDGRVAGILAPNSGAAAAAEIDATGLVVMPGALDVHLHLGHGRDIAVKARLP